eukprot:SAG31_NODE_1243_length_9148_cov_8.476738_1_plen_66_part_00
MDTINLKNLLNIIRAYLPGEDPGSQSAAHENDMAHSMERLRLARLLEGWQTGAPSLVLVAVLVAS